MSFTKNIYHILIIDAPVIKVWNALTDPQLIKYWLWDTEIKVESDWKVGSPILFKGQFHDLNFISKGIILKLNPQKLFQYTYWSPISELADKPENYHTLTFTLNSQENKTILELEVTNLINEVIYGHMNFYWKTTLYVLKKLSEEDKEN